MKTVGKLIAISAIFLTLSCNDNEISTLGANIINQIDSTAVQYDGQFNTEIISPVAGSWQPLVDAQSGMHTYKDYLSRGYIGSKQAEMVIGQFNEEESFGYISFLPELDIDTLIDTVVINGSDTIYDTTALANTVAWYVDSLIRTAGKDSVSTALSFYMNRAKHTQPFYNIEISTSPYSSDSVFLDTTSSYVMQNIVIPGDTSKFTFELPYHYYLKEAMDTVYTTDFTGTQTFSFDKVIVKTTYTWATGSLDSTITVDTLLPLAGDTTVTFKSDKVAPYHLFGVLSEGAEVETTSVIPGYSYAYYYLTEIELDNQTITDTTFQTGRIDSLIDTVVFTDTLLFPTYNYLSSDTIFLYLADLEEQFHLDSVYEIYDTTTIITDNSVIQLGISTWDSVSNRSRAYVSGDSVQNINTDSVDAGILALDTINMVFKNVTDAVNPLLHLQTNPVLHLIAYKDGSADTLSILPTTSKMNVFSPSVYTSTNRITVSGGTERFARLKMATAPFWSMMNSAQYLTIVQGNVAIPVANIVLPEHLDSTIILRTMISEQPLSNGALLSDSGSVSRTAILHADSTFLNVDITDYLVDQYYESSSASPETYLYLWIDGSDMGQVQFAENSDYRFTYIVQNKQ